jgi:protein involved in polysaccharide export with SLBB domain
MSDCDMTFPSPQRFLSFFRKVAVRWFFFPAVAVLIASVLCGSIPLHASQTKGTKTYLKPGDSVRISIWRGGDLGGDYAIDEDGMLSLPLIGKIEVEEISTDSLKRLLVNSYSHYLKDPYITVVPLFRINVMGEVVNPGLYPVDATLGLSDILALAGGVTESGDIHRIKVVEDGQVVTKDLRSELEGDAPIERIGIQSGDQIIVGKKGGLSARDWTLVVSMVSATALVINVLTR